MISVYRAGQLKRFEPFPYLNHSYILSLNVKVRIRFTVFLQISLCFFICQELCWIRDFLHWFCALDLCIVFCFQLEGGAKSLRIGRGGGGLKNSRTGGCYQFGGRGALFLLGGGESVPHYMP